jgi:hypothetical protein
MSESIVPFLNGRNTVTFTAQNPSEEGWQEEIGEESGRE